MLVARLCRAALAFKSFSRLRCTAIGKGGIAVFCAGCAVTAIVTAATAFAATFTTGLAGLAFFTRGIRARGVIARRSGHGGLVGQCKFFLGSIAWRAVALSTAVAALTTWTLTATLAFTAWLLLTATFSAAFAWCALWAGLGAAFAAGFTRLACFTWLARFTAVCATIATAFAAGTALTAAATAAVTATSLGALAAFTTLVATAIAALVFSWLLGRAGWRSLAAKQAFEPTEEAFFSRRRCSRCAGCRRALPVGSRCNGLWFGRCDGGWHIRQNTLDDGFLLVVLFLAAACHQGRVFNFFSEFVARLDVVQTRVVVFETLELVVRRFQSFVGHQQHVDALLHFDFGNFRTLFVQQERGNIDGHLAQHRGGAVLHGLFLDDAQNLQCAGFCVADVAGTTATRAGDRSTFGQGRAQALAAHFHQAEFADGAELHAGAVLAQRVAKAVFDVAPVAAFFHVNEVDDDQAAQVAQAHLAGHFVSSFEVGAGGSFFDVAALDGAGRVNVHRNQSFGVVDHDGAARRQLHGAGVSRLDLVLDLEAAEQRRVVAVAFDAVLMLGHDMRHELLGLFVDVVGVKQDIADVAVEVVADGADDQARFLVNQESAFAVFAGAFDGGPQLDQVVQVPLQLGRAAADAGSARDDAGAGGVFQLVHGFFEFSPVIALDAPADAAAARVVGHEHHITTGQADEGGQGRALVATFFFFDLDHHFLALADHVVDAGLVDRHAGGEVVARDFFERQKTVSVFAVIDKAGFQRRLDAGDNGLVDVALALLAPFNFNLVVEEFLSVNNGQPAFFSLGGINQHPFHRSSLSFLCVKPELAHPTAPIGLTMPKADAMRTGGIAERALHVLGLNAQKRALRRGVGA